MAHVNTKKEWEELNLNLKSLEKADPALYSVVIGFKASMKQLILGVSSVSVFVSAGDLTITQDMFKDHKWSIDHLGEDLVRIDIETAKLKTYKTVMVLAKVNDVDRNDIEGFEGVKFEDNSQFINTSGLDVKLMDLTDFVDFVNDQCFNDEDYWITYIKLAA
jgi:hypothetical protein